MSFVNAMDNHSKITCTENGMRAVNTTDSYLLDLFANIGNMRQNSPVEVVNAIAKAFNENPKMTIKLAFYARDVRGGIGERRNGLAMFRYLAENCPDIMRKNIKYIPEYGRWDDLYALIDTPIEKDMWSFIAQQLSEDMENSKNGKPISLCAKWLKSAEKCSKKTNALGTKTRIALSLNAKQYRKMLSRLRKYIDVTERKMCAKDWESIEYKNVPSYAMSNYRKAFYRHDESRFSDYIASVQKGETKINSSTLYPYNLTEKYMMTAGWSGRVPAKDPVVEAQWKALPNYIDGEHNVVVIADTSGSMYGRPMCAAIGLALYFAERNRGEFHGRYMTFSSRPSWVKVQDGSSLRDNCVVAYDVDWGGSTNIQRAMKMILDICVNNHLKQEDVPKALVIISDMQFNCVSSVSSTYFKTIQEMYSDAGYVAPNIVFWNASEYSRNTHHASALDKYVQMYSGYSASIFKQVISSIDKTPYEAMMDTLNSERYQPIVIE